MNDQPQNDSHKKGLFDLPDFWADDDYQAKPKKPDAPETEEPKKGPGNRKYKQGKKTKEFRIKLKKEAVAEVVNEKIEAGTSMHIVSNGTFDYWNIVTQLIELHGIKKGEFYGSTWTMNDANVQSLLGLLDGGQLRSASVIVGLYFLHREPVVADSLKEGLEGRAQRFAACDNHAKVVLISDGVDFLVFEGSANFTANPRIEQFVLNNDEGLYNFHKSWMDGYFK